MLLYTAIPTVGTAPAVTGGRTQTVAVVVTVPLSHDTVGALVAGRGATRRAAEAPRVHVRSSQSTVHPGVAALVLLRQAPGAVRPGANGRGVVAA